MCSCISVLLARAADASFATIERGHHLVDAGDCVACHTDAKGRPFAGGRPIETPFGDHLFAQYHAGPRNRHRRLERTSEFYRAMHEGIRPGRLAALSGFPYPYFTKMTRDDVMAIRAYLNTLPAVKNEPRKPELTWPLNHRVFMRGWDLMFFKPGTFRPDPNKSAEWNRGAYLVQGAGHCGACHTPKNELGGDKTSERAARRRRAELVRAEARR